MATYTERRRGIGFSDLPYRLEYSHWSMNAWAKGDGRGYPGPLLASVAFPVGNCGPFDPPKVQDRVFAELDAKARAALAAEG